MSEPVYLGCIEFEKGSEMAYGPEEFGYTSETCQEACSEFPYFAL